MWLTLSVCDGIVEALCVFPLEDLPVICSRWMAGGTSGRRWPTRDPELFYRTIVRIAGALEWANTEHHIVHRDLKPENILLDERGRAAVTRLGHRAAGATASSRRRPRRHLVFGTAAYASPEQLLGGVPLDLRSDIYSLGVLMYEWETGEIPFTGTGTRSARRRSAASRPQREPALPQDVLRGRGRDHAVPPARAPRPLSGLEDAS